METYRIEDIRDLLSKGYRLTHDDDKLEYYANNVKDYASLILESDSEKLIFLKYNDRYRLISTFEKYKRSKEDQTDQLTKSEVNAVIAFIAISIALSVSIYYMNNILVIMTSIAFVFVLILVFILIDE